MKKNTFSSLEIAEVTGKQHKDILFDIRKQFELLEIHSAEFSAQYKDSTGRMLQMFILDTEQSRIYPTTKTLNDLIIIKHEGKNINKKV